MRVLLSDGSGLTARQCATLLARAGHEVGVLAPAGLALSAMTGAVHHRHPVPVFGVDPLAWAAAMLAVLDTGRYDVLLPTQEQVAVLSLLADEVTARGVGTAVPPFAALRRVFDKLAAEDLLSELGLPRPPATIARTPDDLRAAELPAYLKAPVATASTGVRLVRTAAELPAAGEVMAGLDAYRLGGVLVQRPVPGPLLMVQAVFDGGRLIALHANRRDRIGSGGGASQKTSVDAEPVRPTVELVGTRLGWHGALSFDAIDSPDGPVLIDVNPRLVEPGNAAAAGLDLVGALLAVAVGEPARPRPAGRPGVRTTQLLLAALGAAQRPRGRRRAVLRELAGAATRTGDYRGAREELSPLRGDPRAAAWLAGLSALLLVAPGAATRLAGGSVANYALTPAGWRQLLEHSAARRSAPGPRSRPPAGAPRG
jgi:glutathione synthase/RimK-type ligase-like ATP-grasp enzyme